jgi:hypothetical protein
MNEEEEPFPNEFQLVTALDAEKFERYLRLRALELGNRSVPPPPSTLGRFVHPATRERTLVLFTLGAVVLLIIFTLLVLVAWSSPGESTVAALTTLAGTGLGFIGGMVSRERAPDADQPT